MSAWPDFQDVYDRYSPGVYRRALQLLGDSDAANDATQEVFMRVIRSGEKILPQPTPTAWLYRVTTNLCLNRLRDQRRRGDLLAASTLGTESVPAHGEARAMVTQILSRVPEELQDVALYFFVDELTYDEMAPLLGVSRRTVSNRLAAFRELVARQFPEARMAS